MKLYALMTLSAFLGLVCIAQAAPARQPLNVCTLKGQHFEIADE